jgi:hypothetical protein
MRSQRVAMRMSVTVYRGAGRFNSPRRARDVRIAVSPLRARRERIAGEWRSLCATDVAIHVNTKEGGVRAGRAVRGDEIDLHAMVVVTRSRRRHRVRLLVSSRLRRSDRRLVVVVVVCHGFGEVQFTASRRMWDGMNCRRRTGSTKRGERGRPKTARQWL